MSNLSLRFANIIHLQNLTDERIWDTILDLKINASLFRLVCRIDGLYDGATQNGLINRLERRLHIDSSNKSYNDISEQKLKKALNMYIYLNVCSNKFQEWYTFYYELFDNNSPFQIVLALNRISNFAPDQTERSIAEKLFINITDLFSLKHQEINSLVNGSLRSYTGDLRKELESKYDDATDCCVW